MILLDTHVWVWWVSDSRQLSQKNRELLERGSGRDLGVSVISCWEVAKLIQLHRLKLDRPLEAWIDGALANPRIELVGLSPRIVIESTRLPEPFHRDPADQLIVATARILACSLLTEDAKIIAYPHVDLAGNG